MTGRKRWIRNADVVVTMDANRSELAGADILAVDGRQYPIRINRRWRLCFEWPKGQAGPNNVEIVDYHG